MERACAWCIRLSIWEKGTESMIGRAVCCSETPELNTVALNLFSGELNHASQDMTAIPLVLLYMRYYNYEMTIFDILRGLRNGGLTQEEHGVKVSSAECCTRVTDTANCAY